MSTNDPLIGKQFGDYKIERLLGTGGMARVYLGYDEKLARHAAVKVSEPTLVAGEYEDEFRERFLREARSIARLRHPRIIGIYQFNQVGNLYYMAMELVTGNDLRQVLKGFVKTQEYMPQNEILTVMRDIADALDYAHQQGVIHRDVKPSNIMVKEDGHAMLMDFGLALNVPEGTIGNTFGSVHYIAPEQAISSAQAVPQSDLYSLGVVLYEMLTGRVPFDDASAMSVALKHISDPPPTPSLLNPKIAVEVEEVVIKALDKDPAKRYATGAEFVRALETAFASGSDPKTAKILPTVQQKTGTVVPELDDAPTVMDTSSRPQILKQATLPVPPPSLVPPQEQRTPAGLLIAGVLIFAAVLAGVLFAISSAGSNSGDVEGTQTAVALAVVDITEEVEPTAEVVVDVTEEPTTFATDTPTTAPTQAAPTDTPTAEPTQAAPTQTLPTEPVIMTAGDSPVLLRYDGRIMVMLNRSEDETVNVEGITFVQVIDSRDGITFRASDWTTGDLSEFRAERCYQILSTGFTALPPNEPPIDNCGQQGFRQSRNTFWVSANPAATFEVRRSGQVLAVCPVSAPESFVELRCEVPLQDVLNPTDIPLTETPTSTPSSTPTDAPIAQPSSTPTTTPTNTPPPPTPTNTNVPSPTPQPTASPTLSLVAGEGEPQALLIYDGRSLVIFNRDPSVAINITSVTFVQTPASGSEVIYQTAEWTTGELNALRPSRCYHVWSTGYVNLPASEPPADNCVIREGVRQTSRAFWISRDEDATFEVRRGSQVLAVCPVALPDVFEQKRCAFNVRR